MSAGDSYGFTDELVLETVDLSGDGGVRKLVFTRGEGPPAAAGEMVHAHYDGRLAADGSQFDSSYNRGSPFSFKLGAGQVIQAWDLAFASMALGEKAVIEVAPAYGYGARGAGSVSACPRGGVVVVVVVAGPRAAVPTWLPLGSLTRTPPARRAVPPNAKLYFLVELLAIGERGKKAPAKPSAEEEL